MMIKANEVHRSSEQMLQEEKQRAMRKNPLINYHRNANESEDVVTVLPHSADSVQWDSHSGERPGSFLQTTYTCPLSSCPTPRSVLTSRKVHVHRTQKEHS